jgi:hypothetical protein
MKPDLNSAAMNADDTAAADKPTPEVTQAAGSAEEQPTQLGDAAAEGKTQSINAWSLADDDDTEVVNPHRRSWKLPIALAAAALVAVGGVAGYQQWSKGDDATSAAPKSEQHPLPPASPSCLQRETLAERVQCQVAANGAASAAPLPAQIGGRMVEHNLHLDGEPVDWTAVESDLHRQGIDIEVNTVGVITSLKFANLGTAPNNWLRWYAKHVTDEPWEPGPGKSVPWFDAQEAGLPVPPPPDICYASGGKPVPIAQFPDGPYSDRGPTPGSISGH